jgi:hypothetical protein
LAPASSELVAATAAYAEMQRANGGNLYVGRHLGDLLGDAGFTGVWLDARYERYLSARVIADYLAEQLLDDGQVQHAETLRSWAEHPRAMFAQAWVSAVAARC